MALNIAHPIRVVLVCLALICTSRATAQREAPVIAGDAEARLQQILTPYHTEAGFPGATLGYALPDGRTGSVSVGFACTETGEAMTGEHRMMAGSTGKTFWAAAALLLVQDGTLDLDARISTYLGDEPWFGRLPNARDITVRQLINHTSGLPRYVTLPAFAQSLRADFGRRYEWVELLEFIFDHEPLFPAGEDWSYADTNYIVLGIIIEAITDDSFYNIVHERILRPNALWDIVPTTSQDIPGLACGYINTESDIFGLPQENVVQRGRYAFNPQFEWAGGGFASTPRELARWASLLYGGAILSEETMVQALSGTTSPMLGPGATYGLGVMMRPSPSGSVHGHAGYFPGYLTDMAYYADHGLALALQINTTATTRAVNPASMRRVLDECAAALTKQASAADPG